MYVNVFIVTDVLQYMVHETAAVEESVHIRAKQPHLSSSQLVISSSIIEIEFPFQHFSFDFGRDCVRAKNAQ